VVPLKLQDARGNSLIVHCELIDAEVPFSAAGALISASRRGIRSRRIILYAPYWVFDMSGLGLVLSEDKEHVTAGWHEHRATAGATEDTVASKVNAQAVLLASDVCSSPGAKSSHPSPTETRNSAVLPAPRELSSSSLVRRVTASSDVLGGANGVAPTADEVAVAKLFSFVGSSRTAKRKEVALKATTPFASDWSDFLSLDTSGYAGAVTMRAYNGMEYEVTVCRARMLSPTHEVITERYRFRLA